MILCSCISQGVSCFSGFPCRDASLRNEGCFFPVPTCRSLLRSKSASGRNTGRSPCITAMVFTVFCLLGFELSSRFHLASRQGFLPFFVGTRCHFLALRSLRLCASPPLFGSSMGINPIPTWMHATHLLSICCQRNRFFVQGGTLLKRHPISL